MLKRRNKPSDKKLNKNPKSTDSIPVTYITESTTITADMSSENDVRIAGKVKGKVESKKKIIITETGNVSGSISSPAADISGTIDGDIDATDSLVLRASAKVDGELITAKIKIEEGAQITGSFQVGNSTSVKPKLSKKGS
jgi:cytoskeletal protein CcmA (bactofilin family)